MTNFSIVIFFIVFGVLAKVNSHAGVKLNEVQSISKFLAENPGTKLVRLDTYTNEDASRTYSLGLGSDQKKWPSSQNVTTTLSYPSTGGNGAYLTYILINCEQSSNIGNAYVTQGGVQQHFVQIVIETSFTNYFNYAAFFYGIQ
ncbi:unnamed protein product [Diamesa tonsa]